MWRRTSMTTSDTDVWMDLGSFRRSARSRQWTSRSRTGGSSSDAS